MVAGLFMAGILAANAVAGPLVYAFVGGFAVVLVALLRPTWRPVLLWPSVILLGWIRLGVEMAVLSPWDLRTVIGPKTEYVTVRGSLGETPSFRQTEVKGRTVWHSTVTIRVDSLRGTSVWQPAVGRVAATLPGLLDDSFGAGQRVEVTGVVRPPRGPVAEGLFDYRAYLRAQGIYYQLATEGTNDWSVMSSSDASRWPPWPSQFLRWAQGILAKGLPGEDEPLRLLWAMTLGWKTALTNDVSEPFMRNGTLHIFAISGLHIALIAGILVSVLRVLRWPRAVCGLATVPAIWFYTAATGWQSSAIRSAVMMTIIIGGWALRRPSDLLNSLAAAAVLILLWEPLQLFQAGFQLSFMVVLSMALFLPPLENLRRRWLRPDPFLPPGLRTGGQKWLDRALRVMTTSVATSLAAWLGSLPLIAYYFYLVTPVSLLANLLIVPLSSFALMANLGSLICGDWLPEFTGLFNHSAWFWMSVMIRLSDWTADLPGAYFYVQQPSLVVVAFYYLILAASLSGWAFVPPRRKWMSLAVGLVAGIWLLSWWTTKDEVQITILPLGGGPILADLPGRDRDLLVDCGSQTGAEMVVKPFLHSRGLSRLPRVLLTHGDLQRVGGVDYLRRHFSVAEVLTSSIRFRSPAYRRIISDLPSMSVHHRQIKRGDSIHGWSVLHPEAADRFSQADDSAVVLRAEFHGLRVLLLSDLGRLGQRALLEREADLRADIVVAGLPVQGEPLTGPLLERIRPRLIVLASSENRGSPPGGRGLGPRLRATGIPVIDTGIEGAVRVTARRKDSEVKSMKGVPFLIPRFGLVSTGWGP